MFGATNKGIDNDQSKYVQSDGIYGIYGMAFDGLGLWSHWWYWWKDWYKVEKVEKKFSVNFDNIKQKFVSVCITMITIVICLLMK